MAPRPLQRRGLWAALVTPLATLVLLAAPLARGGAAGGASIASGGNSGPSQPPCVGYSQNLRNGNCAGFTSYFRGNPACGGDEATFRTAMNGAPAPSDGCCSDAQAYIQNGCNCDQQTLSLARQNGYDTSSVPCIVRAVLKSRCNNGLSAASC